MKKFFPLIVAAAVIPSGVFLYNKYNVYEKAKIEYSRELGKYKVQKIMYDDLASTCARANADMNSAQDSMNNLVSDAMINGTKGNTLSRQGSYSQSFNEAYSFVRDNCIGIEYSAPTPPVHPTF